MSTETSHLRSDAAENRDRILAAARELFAERGLDVQMASVARRAGVGVATLYRRFPTKESLVSAVFAGQFRACVANMDEAIADPDPWRGLTRVIEGICAMQAHDRGFSAAFLEAFPTGAEDDRARAVHDITVLIERAKQSGQLRADFEPTDLTLVLMANNGIVADTPEAAEAASRRLVAYLLNSFRAGHARPLPPPASVDLLAALASPSSRTSPQASPWSRP
ncbi:TetR/AcrR family transcriptional regulator [Kutzneria sp. 744]|uniref:TetR/AcrR family transcriptional regulator n=1 Tax=Kutzneria sp. (strain 744) TaxID=345341 RepID=UPI0003EEC957|nr:TetR/AcrR family transcriptional regulator [Kutzneria sp. 744]EWM19409.1 transcriptional regulator [Kutzneria sp. 744]